MRLTTFLAFATGFVALSYEILWFRLISFISGGSPNAFGLLLASFLLGIALGSLIAKRYCGNSTETNKQTLLMIPAWVSLGIAVLGFIFPPLGAEFVIHWHYGWLLVFIIFISALMGAILPILSHYALLPNAAVGRGISWIYFFNILGATSGTLLTGFVLLDEFTFAETNALISTIGVCISFLFFIQGGRKGILFLISATLSSAFLILAMSRTAALYSDLWVKLLFKSNYSDKYKVTRIVENRSGVILVTKSGGVYGGGRLRRSFQHFTS
jgi:spermidine synthase